MGQWVGSKVRHVFERQFESLTHAFIATLFAVNSSSLRMKLAAFTPTLLSLHNRKPVSNTPVINTRICLLRLDAIDETGNGSTYEKEKFVST